MNDIIVKAKGATDLDPDERAGLKFKHITTRDELNELEQANIDTGLLWLARQKASDVLTLDFVNTLHAKLFGDVWDWAGSYRRTGKNIGIDARQIAVQTRYLLDEVAYWIEHQTYPPSEIAIRFHHQLVFIHPFPNGNGRHSRIITDALVEKVLKIPPLDWDGGFDLTQDNERRDAYIDALKAADRADYRPLLAYIGPRDDLK